jgi:hypothetical protein
MARRYSLKLGGAFSNVSNLTDAVEKLFLRRVQKVFWPVRCVEGLARRGIAPKAKVFRTAFSAKLCIGIAANMDAEGIQREFIVSAICEFFTGIDPY